MVKYIDSEFNMILATCYKSSLLNRFIIMPIIIEKVATKTLSVQSQNQHKYS